MKFKQLLISALGVLSIISLSNVISKETEVTKASPIEEKAKYERKLSAPNIPINPSFLPQKETEKQMSRIKTQDARYEKLLTLDPNDIASWTRYTSTDYGIVNDPVSQYVRNTCWSFGTAGASETSVLREGLYPRDEYLRFSEDNIAFVSFNRTKDFDPLGNTSGDLLGNQTGNYVESDWDKGHYAKNAVEAMSQWAGPVYRTKDSYGDTEFYTPDFLLNESVVANSKNMNEIKYLVAKYGAAIGSYGSAPYTSNFVKVDESKKTQPHAVSIVGWDDNIDPRNFTKGPRPTTKGAWLIRNSWGPSYPTEANGNGLFWLSYESKIWDILAVDYDKYEENRHNYYYDGQRGDNADISFIHQNGEKPAIASAIFESKVASASEREFLDSVNVKIFGNDVSVHVDIYLNVEANPGSRLSKENKPTSGTLVASADKTFELGGNRTIELPERIELKPGQFFSVVISASNATNDAAIITSFEQFSYNDLTYYMNEKGEWENCITNNNGVARINAFTRSEPKVDDGLFDLSGATITHPYNHYRYGGKKDIFENKPVVMYKGEILEEGKDYDISYKEELFDIDTVNTAAQNAVVGSGKIIITGKNRFEGTAKVSHYSIGLGDVPSLEGVGKYDYYYDVTAPKGTKKVKELALPNGWVWANPNQDINYNVNGEMSADIYYVGKDSSYYSNSMKTVYIKESKADQINFTNKLKITNLLDSYVYNGGPILPSFNIEYQGMKLTKNQDYQVEYIDNINAGLGKIIVRGMGSYKGQQTFTFEIKKADNKISSIEVFEGKPKAISTFGEVKYRYFLDQEGKNEATTLVNGEMYYALPYVEGTLNYNKVVSSTLTPTKVKYEGDTITKPTLGKIEVLGTYTYNSLEQNVRVNVFNSLNQKLTEGTDYKIVYSGNRINVGKVNFDIVGLNTYAGMKKSSSFEIKALTLASKDIKVNDFKDKMTYVKDGNIQNVSITKEGKVVAKDNYDISYLNNEKPGQATMVITFKNNYQGVIELPYTIEKMANEIKDLVLDSTNTPSAKATHGTVKFKYYNKNDLVNPIDTKPTTPGNYVVVAYVDETDYYLGATKQIEFEIKAHVHSFGKWETTKEPTCILEGLEHRVCSICGEEEARVIEAKGHRWDVNWTVDIESTCKHEGSKSHHCLDCDEKKDITVIPQLTHKWGSWDVVVEATPNQEGLEKRVCELCGEEETRTTPKTSHEFGPWVTVKEPTCTEPGLERRTCSKCGEVDEREIAPKGHNWDTKWTVDVESTCELEGSKSHHCLNCDEKKDVTSLPKLNHQFGEWIVIVKPGCETNGLERRTCKNCNHFEERVIDALGHNFGKWETTKAPTCTEPGLEHRVCTICGEEETRVVAAKGHRWDDKWTIDTEATCEHEGSKSHHCLDCDEKKDVTVIEKLAHSYGEWMVVREATYETEGLEKKVCSVCGDEVYRAIPKLIKPEEPEKDESEVNVPMIIAGISIPVGITLIGGVVLLLIKYKKH